MKKHKNIRLRGKPHRRTENIQRYHLMLKNMLTLCGQPAMPRHFPIDSRVF
jgi:hypothetical protein